MKTVAFCITCKFRTQHLELTLPINLKNNPQAKFVLLNYNSPDHLEDYIKKDHSADLESGRLVVYRFTEPGPFRMAHAKNLAHRLGIHEGADILLNLDADNLTGEGFDQYILEHMSAPPPGDDLMPKRSQHTRVFLWAKMLKGEMKRGISGRIAVTKEAFYTTGGYDEVFSTWSPDDKDFNIRLNRLGYQGREIEHRFLDAVSHNDKMRFKEYPHAADAEVVESFNLVGREGITIANNGHFGCGVVFRNFDRHPIEMAPLPTRVFGIGWHKTATVSLHHALTLLGLSCAHWPSAHWAKAVWGEMTSQGRSVTLERFYAACDTPIPLLYEQLYKAYPNSKFILTLRDEEDWLESIEAHWSDTNPFRKEWDHDPWSHKAHQIMYGRKDFDREVFRQRYRKHNADVLEFFKDKPKDLLVMDMSNGGNPWFSLCGFLRFPIPEVPYPKRNVKQRH